MQLIKAPEPFIPKRPLTIFLAGSIEQGIAEKWQDRVCEQLKDLDVVILNPRRDEWDASWKQDFTEPNFREQVEWELEALEYADFIFMYFSPGTQSPISLLELGLYADSGKLAVCCPEGFWRKGNVDIVCHKYSVQILNSLDEFVHLLRNLVNEGSL